MAGPGNGGNLDQQSRGTPNPPSRTAVVVIAGVGDKPTGTASLALAHGLVRHDSGRFLYAESADEDYATDFAWCGVAADDGQTVTRHTVFDLDSVPRADIYEAWWADLSRFPGATRSAFLAAIGMLQQATTIGAAALRGGGPIVASATPDPAGDGGEATAVTVSSPGTEATPAGFRHAAGVMTIIEWLVAVPLISIVAIHLGLLGAAYYAMSTNGATHTSARVGLALIGAISVAGLVFTGVWYRQRRGDSVLWVGVPLLAGVAGLAAARTVLDQGLADRGLADTILALGIYPLRIGWMLVAALALVASGLVLATVAARLLRGRTLHDEHVWARAGTAALSMFGPFGLAMVGTLAYAAFGAAAGQLAKQSHFEPGVPGGPWCIHGLNDWVPAGCAKDIDVFDWGMSVFQQGVVPLVYVAAIALLVLALTAIFVGLEKLWRREEPSIFLRRFVHLAPRGVMVGLLVAAGMVLLAYLPLGDHLLAWQAPRNGQSAPLRTAATLLAATVGWVITALFAVSRSLKLSTSTLRGQGTIGDRIRIPLDLAYDIATFLRERGRYEKKYGKPVPRDKILARFSGLMHHLSRVRRYDRCIVVAHSQGTVLATAMLNQPVRALTLPGRCTALVTMGCPLRRLYAWRLPTQFGWVRDLCCADTPRYVTRVDGPWINFGANHDLVGRTILCRDSDGVMHTDDWTCMNMTDRRSGARNDQGAFTGKQDDHGSYWTDRAVMTKIGDLILDGFSPAAPPPASGPGA